MMKFLIKKYSALSLSALLLVGCGSGSGSDSSVSNNETSESTPEVTEPVGTRIEHLAGGTASIADSSAFSLSNSSDNMTNIERIKQFNLGDDLFENPWVAGSSSTSLRDGLGGLFNNNACQDCHIKDGRGHAPNEGESDFSSILFRTARSNIESFEADQMLQSQVANFPDSSTGGQLQQDAVAGVLAEVDLAVSYEYSTVKFTDGHSVELRKPLWAFTNKWADKGYDFDTDTLFSARVAPAMTGLGLLALISEKDILANQDVDDIDGNGISGKANYVQSAANNNIALGRFGWKSGQPTILEQSAGAFVNDMGLTNRLHQTDTCLAHQIDCITAPDGNGDSVDPTYPYEVEDKILADIAFYSSHLAVPERRNAYAENVQNGKTLFNDAGCQQCHQATYTTQRSTEHPELSEQVIFPYTDMLLHDMGEGLADFTFDNKPGGEDTLYEFLATAREWRTSPLWAIGLAKKVSDKASFLHDGRARTLMEAVLWHGGEGEAAKQKVLNFTSQEREDFIAFLEDL